MDTRNLAKAIGLDHEPPQLPGGWTLAPAARRARKAAAMKRGITLAQYDAAIRDLMKSDYKIQVEAGSAIPRSHPRP